MRSVSPLAITMGDPAGIGPEIIAKAWNVRQEHGLSPFFVVGDRVALSMVWDGPLQTVDSVAAAVSAFDHALPIWHGSACGAVVPGKPSKDGAYCALHALNVAITLTRSRLVSGLVTGPISKEKLRQIGWSAVGQTEFLAEICGIAVQDIAMMLAAPTLRVVPLTTHIPLADVADTLTIALILAKIRTVVRALRCDFGIMQPRLALCGLNPHAGENGTMGREEIDIMAPAVEIARREDIAISGPLAADSLFSPTLSAMFDVLICPYHDQALAPFKALHFHDGVNVTLGLPIIRTSPDHGTAYDIAGSGRADPRSMIAAIALATEMSESRSVTAA